jgi:hypothetical protein
VLDPVFSLPRADSSLEPRAPRPRYRRLDCSGLLTTQLIQDLRVLSRVGHLNRELGVPLPASVPALTNDASAGSISV